MSVTESLRQTPLFAGLSEAQFESLIAVARPRRASNGEVILKEGGESTSLLILTSGAALVSRRLGLASAAEDDEATEKTLVRLPAPQFFGEMALLGETRRTATISAAGECELLEIGRHDFERLVAQDSLLGYRVVCNIALTISDRLRRTDRDVLKLTVALSLALGNR